VVELLTDTSKMSKEWFAEWFDSPYYHTLYKSHNEEEAQRTLDNLLAALALPPNARVLDLACGKGRHARYLSERNFDVTGLDISLKSIAFARQFEHDSLHFYQHDMRLPFRVNYYDAVVNFFTSFGYFDNDADHLRSIQNVALGLKPGGMFLLDFLNAAWVRQHIVPSDTKTIDGIQFYLKKHIQNGHVFKIVEFEAGDRSFKFEERVRLFTLDEFKVLFATAGLELKAIYGGYDLSAFDLTKSSRLILIAQKSG
jgi:SAM-dependent methyltransferase